MELNEKLQALRRARGLTQEELAEALYVSRTAVSKWETGKGYPNIESLKALSAFFAVSLDELLCAEELLTLAEHDKAELKQRTRAWVCCASDMLSALLLLLPLFGTGAEPVTAACVFALEGVPIWEKAAFISMLALMALNGVCGAVLLQGGRSGCRSAAVGRALSVAGTLLFMAASQPYPGMLCFALLVMKELPRS